ncbi:MAG: S8 family serine peptidase [Actinomycetaceae bacterium]|nr:S8 family serine peptidase [Actinomycetaceae bacterium]
MKPIYRKVLSVFALAGMVSTGIPLLSDSNASTGGVALEQSDTRLAGLDSVISESGNQDKLRVIVQTQPRLHKQAIAAIKRLRGAQINYEYTTVLNGASITLPTAQLRALDQIDGLTYAEKSRHFKPQMLKAKEMVNAVSVAKKHRTDGRGMVIALVDSGVDVTHKDMRLDPGVTPKIKTVTPTPVGDTKFTQKIPHGYNFVAHNHNLLEEYERPHGMHIAGILAGNATDEDVAAGRGIDGMAPNAQLLVYRVFSDRADTVVPIIDDTVYAAMEDAVKHGADVMSLSIGDYGTGKRSDAFYKAVENAKKHGIVIAGSMGNAGTSGSTSSYDRYTNETTGGTDLATTVSVAANLGVIGVGSTSHTYRESHQFQLADAKYFYIPVSYSTVPTQNYQLVDAGNGTDADVTKATVSGKVAIIGRTQEDPKAQFDRLRAAGAKGVIIYNSNLGRNRDYYHTEAAQILEENVAKDLWGISVSYDDGQKILAQVKNSAGTNLRLQTLGMKAVKKPGRSEISGFSSWGSTVDLELKPDLVAPGEDILSTFNHNRLGTMSGTSMSTPVVAGAAALLLPTYRGLNKPANLDMGDFTRIMMMNTAKPMRDRGALENSPRQQGAGMLDVDSALENKVLLTANGRGAATLKEIKGDTVTFTATLRNMGKKPASYNLRPSKVMSTGFVTVDKGTEKVQEVHSVAVPGGTLEARTQKVTVAPGKEVEVEFTLKTPSSVTDRFMEGYIYFKSTDSQNLVLPYFGYKGDWGADPIIDTPRWEKGNKTGLTAMMTSAPSLTKDKFILQGLKDDKNYQDGTVDPENIAFSPSSKNTVTTQAMIRLGVLRDLVDYRIDVVDAKTASALPLYTIATGPFLEKFRRADWAESDFYKKKFTSPPENQRWNGDIYDPKSGKLVTAPAGQYYIRVAARNDLDKPYQLTYLPVKIDNKAPTATLQKTSSDYEVTASDENGIWLVKATLDSREIPVEKNGDGKWKIRNVTAAENAENQLKIQVIDHAGNYKILNQVLDTPNIITSSLKEFGIGKNKQLTIKVSKKVAKVSVQIDGTDQKVESAADHSYKIAKPDSLAQGKHKLTITGKDAKGAQVATLRQDFTNDTEPPKVTYHVDYQDEDANFLKVTGGFALVKGQVTDTVSDAAHLKGHYYVLDPTKSKQVEHPLPVDKNGNFELKVYKSDYPESVSFKFVDEAGFAEMKTFFLTDLDDLDEDENTAPFFTNFDKVNIFFKAENLEDGDIKEISKGKYTTELKVFCDEEEYSVKVNDLPLKKCEGGHVTMALPLIEGANYVNINGYDDKDQFIFEARKYIFLDVHAPTLHIDNFKVSPKLKSDENDHNILGTIWTNKNILKLSGWAEDNGLEWFLRINDSVIKRGKAWREFGGNREKFEYQTKVADGDFLKLYAGDYFGNEDHHKDAKYRVKIDTVKPTVSVNIPALNRPGVVLDAKVQDNVALDQTEYLLDGKPTSAGTAITETGEHRFEVIATDIAGNTTRTIANFAVVGPPKATAITDKVKRGDVKHVEKWLRLDYGTTAKFVSFRPPYMSGEPALIKVLLTNSVGDSKTATYKLTIEEDAKPTPTPQPAPHPEPSPQPEPKPEPVPQPDPLPQPNPAPRPAPNPDPNLGTHPAPKPSPVPTPGRGTTGGASSDRGKVHTHRSALAKTGLAAGFLVSLATFMAVIGTALWEGSRRRRKPELPVTPKQ